MHKLLRKDNSYAAAYWIQSFHANYLEKKKITEQHTYSIFVFTNDKIYATAFY